MVRKARAAGTSYMKQRAPTKEDKALGIKIRVRRIEAKMSQETLGQALGISFQQVQKYEKGVNRVSAARLQQIAKVLGESLDYFNGSSDTPTTTAYTSLLTDAPTQRLLRAFSGIPSQTMRYKIVGLVEMIGGVKAA